MRLTEIVAWLVCEALAWIAGALAIASALAAFFAVTAFVECEPVLEDIAYHLISFVLCGAWAAISHYKLKFKLEGEENWKTDSLS